MIALTIPARVIAGPACPEQTTITQPDGSRIGVFIRGDEFQPWITTSDGYTVIQNEETGYWEYAGRGTNNALTPSGIRVTPVGLPPATLGKNIMPPRDTARELQFNEQLQLNRQKRLGAAKGATVWTPQPLAGTQNLLVVRVSFAGDSAQTLNPAITKEDVANNVFTGQKSVAQYYHDNSQGLISVNALPNAQSSVAGVVDVTLGLSHPWYQNRSYSYTAADEITWVTAALKVITDSTFINLASFDADGDGIFTSDEINFHFIVAGYEAAVTSQTPSVWAHTLMFYGSGPYNLKGWSVSGEMDNSNMSLPIGAITHELGHQMCSLPDLYDVSGSNGGLGYFSLMSAGSWGYDTTERYATTPVALDAWSRQYLGWANPRANLQNGTSLSFPATLDASDSPVKLYNPSLSLTEFFLAENRFPRGWDCGFRGWFGADWGGGLLVLHCDTNVGSGTILLGNNINNYTYSVINPGTWGHQGIMAEEADTTDAPSLVRSPAKRGHKKTLFYSGNAGSFFTNTSPNSNFYSGAASDLGFSDISTPGNPMTATVLLGSVIKVLTPNGVEEWLSGEQDSLYWESTNITNLKFDYSLDNGATWTTVVGSMPASLGAYVWTIPDTTSDSCLVRLSDVSNPFAFDTNDSTFVITTAAHLTLADTPWPMYRRNPRHTGRGVSTVGTSFRIKWTFRAEEAFIGSPIIGPDGTIYAGSYRHLYAINPDGTERWNRTVIGFIRDSPAISANGTIYVGTTGIILGPGFLYAFRPDGTEKWRKEISNVTCSSPAIGDDGTIYIGDTNSLWGITSYGKTKWKFVIGGSVNSPAIGEDGTIYAANSTDGNLYAINKDGSLKWTIPTDRLFCPAIGEDGTIYGGKGYLSAITPDGTQKWKCLIRGSADNSSPSISEDGTIHFCLTAVTPEGTTKWKFDASGYNCYSAIGSDGMDYSQAGYDGYLYAVNPNGTLAWKLKTGEGNLASPIIGADSTLYIGLMDSCLYAICPDTLSLALVSPNGGDFLRPGTQYSITWTSSRIDSLKIECSLGDSRWEQIVASTPASEGTFLWNVPDTISVDCRIRISDVRNSTVQDTSDSTFSIKIVPDNPLADTPWPMKGQNVQHTGRGVATTSTADTVKWVYRTGGQLYYSSPAIGTDGTIYIGARDSSLYAISSDGTMKWRFRMKRAVYSSPAVGVGNIVYVGSHDSCLYSIKPDGTLKWKFLTGGSINQSSPALGADRVIYVQADDGYLYAVSFYGALNWKFSTGDRGGYSSPVIALDGTIYVGTSTNYLYAITTDGIMKWRFQTGGGIQSSPAVAADGTIYFGSLDKYFYAVNPDGTLKWKYLTGSGIYSDPSIGADGRVYFGSYDQILYASYCLFAFSPGGGREWVVPMDSNIEMAPAIGADWTIYVGTNQKCFYAINSDGSLKWKHEGNMGYSSPAIGSDGTLYVGSLDSCLYAFAPENSSVIENIPSAFFVSPPYPNPFNPSTTLEVQLPESGNLRVVMYNILGQEVRVLQNGLVRAGNHKFVWDGKNASGELAASGLYFYRIRAGEHSATGKVLFLR